MYNVKNVLEKVALRQLSDASQDPRKTEKSTTYGSVTLKRWVLDHKVENILN